MTDFFQFDLRSGSRHFAWLLAVAILSAFLTKGVAGQDEEKVVRVQTELAAFEVSVTDKNGRPVRDVSIRDLRLLEDGIERPIEFFQPIRRTGERRPLTVIFALDVSGSITVEELEKLKTAMRSFVSRLADYDSYFSIVTFAMDVRTVRDFTNKRDKLEKAIEKLERDSDGLSTHAYDAVDTSVRLMNKNAPKVVRGRFAKKVIILITDGFPVGDIVSPPTVIERANDAETTVYAVILPSYSAVFGKKRPVMTPLEASGLISRTGGKSYYADAGGFEKLFENLAEEVTGSYAVAFYPPEENIDDGKTHNVRILSVRGHNVRQNRTTYRIER